MSPSWMYAPSPRSWDGRRTAWPTLSASMLVAALPPRRSSAGSTSARIENICCKTASKTFLGTWQKSLCHSGFPHCRLQLVQQKAPFRIIGLDLRLETAGIAAAGPLGGAQREAGAAHDLLAARAVIGGSRDADAGGD